MKDYVGDAFGIIAGITTMITAIANIVLFGGGNTIDVWVLIYTVLLIIGWEVTKREAKFIYMRAIADDCIKKADEALDNDDFEILDAEVLEEE